LNDIVLITQARLGSNRLPNKILLEINNKSIIEHFIIRSKKIKGLDKLIFAIPDNKENNPLQKYLEKFEVEIFRGSEFDVLKRYNDACKIYNPKAILRITSDCPLFDIKVTETLIKLFKNEEIEYASNNLTFTWPHGLDVEIFSRRILDKACSLATKDYDREHVTPWIRNATNIKKLNLECDLKLNLNIRLTIDYIEDYKFLKKLNSMTKTVFSELSITEINKIINKNPSLLNINKSRHLRNNYVNSQ
jgi:spore coat polysaccharide biosynthesis protein SpsF|tara:strand:+ start:270 stop:1013 length:744 start_codon:yes stop_codon:yes gene_type:complete